MKPRPTCEECHEKPGCAAPDQWHFAPRLRAPPRRHRRDNCRRQFDPRVRHRDGAGAWSAGFARGDSPFYGHGRRALRRAAHCLGRQIRLRQLGKRGCAFLRSARRSAAAPVHPHAARGTRRRDGRRLRESFRSARHRHGGRRRRPDQRARPDVQRVERADTARLLFIPDRGVACRRTRRLRGAARTGTAHRADDEAHVVGTCARSDSRDGAARIPRGLDAALRSDVHELALRLHGGEVHGRDHPARSGRSPDAGQAESGGSAARSEAPRGGAASRVDRRRRGLQGEGIRQGGEARRAALRCR